MLSYNSDCNKSCTTKALTNAFEIVTVMVFIQLNNQHDKKWTKYNRNINPESHTSSMAYEKKITTVKYICTFINTHVLNITEPAFKVSVAGLSDVHSCVQFFVLDDLLFSPDFIFFLAGSC